MNSSAEPAVVLVHGLWMRPWVMVPLARRLRRRGFECCCFGYHSVTEPWSAAVARLQAAVAACRATEVFLLGHSLGGRLALAVSDPRLRRVLLLGTPLTASQAALALRRRGWGRRLGGVGTAVLSRPAPAPPPGVAVAAVAGTGGHGLGRLLAPLAPPHDGAVSVAETRAPWLVDHGCLAASHSALLFSRAVAETAAGFFASGRLPRPLVVDCPP